MSFHTEVKRRSYVASIDLSTSLFKIVDQVANVNHKVAISAAGGGIGILLNKPTAGQDASVAVEGQCEVRVGAAVQAGQGVVSAASGWAIPQTAVTTGAPRQVLGRFVTGAASGMLAAVELNPTFVATIA